MTQSNVERAEKATRGRADLMALGAAFLLASALLGFGNPPDSAPTVRGGIWLLQILLFLILLATGGGLMASRNMRALMNDEMSLRNRSRAFSTGFVVTLLTALLIYVVSWSSPIDLRDGIRLITAAGVGGALLCYAWLEWRD